MAERPWDPDEIARLRQQVERLQTELQGVNHRIGELEQIADYFFAAAPTEEVKLSPAPISQPAPVAPPTPIATSAPSVKSLDLSDVNRHLATKQHSASDPVAPRARPVTVTIAPSPASARPSTPESLPSEYRLQPEEPRSKVTTHSDPLDAIAAARDAAVAKISSFRKSKTSSPIDWETLIGGRWMTWVGAFTLLLAVGFGVHWAWTTLHTPPWVHVLSFHLLGIGFLAAAHFLNRRGVPLAVQALVGLGIFTLYGAAFAAEQLYGLWGERTAFIECAGITVLAIALALRANSPAVVLLGALGGYLTPILTSHGSGNYVGLFTYLAFLNVALVSCAVWRGWSFLKPLALAATAIMFVGWINDSHFDPAMSSMVWGTQGFATMHALIFLIGSTVPPLAWRRTSRGADLLALAAGSLFFVGITWLLFRDRPDEQLALVSWGMSALHAVLFGITYSRVTNVDRMPRVHLGLAAAFFTLAIPLQLNDAAYWGATWCVEGLVFTAVGVYFRDRQICGTAAVVLTLAACRLLGWDWQSPPRLIGQTSIDLRFFIFLVAGLMNLICGGMYRMIPWALSRIDVDDAFHRRTAGLLTVMGAILLTLAPMLQVHDWIYLGPIWAAEALAFTLVGLTVRDPLLRLAGSLVFLLAGMRLVAFDFFSPARAMGGTNLDLRFSMLMVAGLAALVGGALYRMLPWALGRKAYTNDVDRSTANIISLIGAAIITLSPLVQLEDWTRLGPIWAIEAVVFTMLGICFRERLFAFIGLVVFLVAAGRLMPYDFRGQPHLIEGTMWDLRFVVIALSGLLAIAAGALYWAIPKLLRRSERVDDAGRAIGGLLLVVGNLALMLSLTCQWDNRLVLVLWTLDASLIWAAGFWFDHSPTRWYGVALALVMVGGRAIHDGAGIDGPYQLILNSRFGSLALVATLYFAAGGVYRRMSMKRVRLSGQMEKVYAGQPIGLDESQLDPLLGILANAVMLIAISLEIHSWYAAAAAAGYAPFADMHMAEMATYSIVWAIYAAAMVAVGFAIRYPLFRILGLVAFGPILLKVFFLDLENLRLFPRVLALAVLGLMLMGVSMLYQKFASRMDRQAEQVG